MAVSDSSKPTTGESGIKRTRRLAQTHPAAFIAAALVALGLGLLAFVATVLDQDAGSILVIAFLAPLLAYVLLTGRLAELTGFGVSAKFREAANQPLADSVERISVEEVQTVEKLSANEIKWI